MGSGALAALLGAGQSLVSSDGRIYGKGGRCHWRSLLGTGDLIAFDLPRFLPIVGPAGCWMLMSKKRIGLGVGRMQGLLGVVSALFKLLRQADT
jgi:hypothetical protein